MSPKLKEFLVRWVNTAIAVTVAAFIIPGIEYDSAGSLIVATLVLGILNSLLRPWLVLLSLPFLIFSLGIFYFFINAALLYWVGALVKGFHVNSFATAFWGGLLISVVSLVLNSLTRTGNARVQVKSGGPPPRRRDHDDGGPVIDV